MSTFYKGNNKITELRATLQRESQIDDQLIIFYRN
jgi:hypothetical protein